MKLHPRFLLLTVSVLAISLVPQSLAQGGDGKVSIHATPRQAYLFVDGRAMGEANKRYSVSAGDHKIVVANYGYTPDTRNITVTSGQTTALDVSLQPITATVSGPFGAMTIENASHAAILLNGKTPEFFVGHGDEFNHEWDWHQELVVPPGTYQVTAMNGDKELWSGPVQVEVNKRTVVGIPQGVRKTVDWPRGAKLSTIPRFTAGTASALVAVAKPTAELTANGAQINCGDSSQLKWTSTDAPSVQINPIGAVASNGDQSVQPKQNTTYEMTAIGPGGTVTSNATVNVNTAVQANLDLAPGEVHYRRVGNKVVQNDGSALNWSATNASNVSIDPLGTVDASGNRPLQITPKQTTPGKIDETVNYTLTATNGCGGSETKTAALHITGEITNPELQLSRSVYFPTNGPRTLKSEKALLPSERESVTALAAAFKSYLSDVPEAQLVLSGHADKRGPADYNQKLSERRAEMAKQFLIEQGVPEASLSTEAYGNTKNLSTDEVKQLLEQNSNLADADKQKAEARIQTIVLANNRRVDIGLKGTSQESAKTYPFNSSDYAALVDRGKPLEASPVENAAEKEKVKN